jgi:hypothetical protein
MKKRSSFLCCFNICKGEDSSEDPPQSEKVYPSDRDNRFGIVGDRHVDAKAEEMIARVRKKSQDTSNQKK